MLDFRDHSHAEYGHATLSLKNARNKSIRLEIKYNLKKKKKDTHRNKFSFYTTLSIAIFNCNPHCDNNNLLF